jgi:glycosyltransferase involved in cell wall biosynthesis
MIFFYVLYGVVSTVFAIGGVRLQRAKRMFTYRSSEKSRQADLPTVSVCMPARNESHAMTESLQRVLASDYEKLEILVADDNSGDKTPALIKAFAHEGVRFIEVTKPDEGWLGKNHTLNTLLKEASGAYVLFLDVDTHLSPRSISMLVEEATQHNAAMVSVLPRREDGIRASTMFAPLRYLWEMTFHQAASPAVASSAWLIDRKRFAAAFTDLSKLRHVIQPEAHIAATFTQQSAYRFIISTPQLGVSHEKKWQSQVDTSTRLLYPLLGSRVVHVLIAMADLVILSLPVLLLPLAYFMGGPAVTTIGVFVYLLGVLVYSLYLRMIWRRGWIVAAALWPIIVLQEACLVARSAYQYRHGLVTWKGRRIEDAQK